MSDKECDHVVGNRWDQGDHLQYSSWFDRRKIAVDERFNFCPFCGESLTPFWEGKDGE